MRSARGLHGVEDVGKWEEEDAARRTAAITLRQHLAAVAQQSRADEPAP